MKFFIPLALALLISTTLKANSQQEIADNYGRKAYYAFSTIAENKSAVEYLSNMRGIPESETIDVAVQPFLILITAGTKEFSSILRRPEVRAHIEKFLSANNLQRHMIGQAALSAAERAYVNVLVLLEFQKQLLARTDLEVFGRNTVHNLNVAINQAIGLQYQNAQQSLARVVYGNLAQKMRDNFLNLGLEHKTVLTPADQWLNELNGRDKNYAAPVDAKNILAIHAGETFKKVSAQYKRSTFNFCSAVFAI